MSGVSAENSNQDVELNLAPIIDCFTVLITYLLVTASFLTLSSVDVGVSATGTAPAVPDVGPPPMVMTLELKANNEMAIQIRGGNLTKQFDLNVASNSGTWNMGDLDAKLQQVQAKWPALNEVSVSADPTVVYKDIVTVIHEIQKIMPKVYISG